MKIRKAIKPIQLNLFEDTVLKSEALKAPDSPKKAFYHIELVCAGSRYIVKKKSGAGKKALNTRSWDFSEYELADKFYQRKIREKTNPNRKTRCYKPYKGFRCD